MSRRIRALGALLATAALLAGCAQAPGIAAVVNGERITENDVADASATFEALLGSAPNVSAVLDALVKEKVVVPVAADFDLEASDAEVIAYFNDYVASQGGEPLAEDQFSEAGLAAGRYLVLMGDTQAHADVLTISDQMIVAFRDADITVNPRHGSYDQDGLLTTTTFPWIHTVAAVG